jgi:hypothetical protein
MHIQPRTMGEHHVHGAPPVVGGWQDTQLLRLYSACSPPGREVATILGACRYPDPTAHQAHGTGVWTTSSPAQLERDSTAHTRRWRAQHHFHPSWCPAGHDNCSETSVAIADASASMHAAKWYGILDSIPLIPTRKEAVSPGGHQLEEQSWRCRIGRDHLIGKRQMGTPTCGLAPR